ncbi:uncharacterized protein METZ01_LOCUS216419, partial [marine metagenome]
PRGLRHLGRDQRDRTPEDHRPDSL